MMEERPDPKRYFFVVRRWLWLVVVCALLAAGASYVISSRMTPVYSASATMLVHQAPTTGTSDYAALLTSERLARTYSEMLSGRTVLVAVIERLELKDETPERLAARMSTDLVEDTQLIRLSVEDTDPELAARLANTIADVFIEQNRALQEERYADSLASVQQQMGEFSVLMEETQASIDKLGTPVTAQKEAEMARLETILAGYRNTFAAFLQSYEQMRLTAAQSVNNVVVVEMAQVPGRPVRPRRTMNAALAGAVGALLAAGVAFVVEYLDDTLKSPDDVRETLGLETLGAIGRFKKGEKELVLLAHPLSPTAEAYRALRTNIRFSSVDEPLRTLLVTSPGPAEGKSITVANLAAAMAQTGLRVAVVDADLRRPRLHGLFGVGRGDGLTGSLLEGVVDGHLQEFEEVERLAVLPAGKLPPNPAELLGSRRMRELLDSLVEQADVVLVDSPPVTAVTDAAVLAREVDGVLLVVAAGETRCEVARRAVESLKRVGAKVVGVVLNRVTVGRGSYYYYYYRDDDRNGHRRRRRTRGRRRRERRNVRQFLVDITGRAKSALGRREGC